MIIKGIMLLEWFLFMHGASNEDEATVVLSVSQKLIAQGFHSISVFFLKVFVSFVHLRADTI